MAPQLRTGCSPTGTPQEFKHAMRRQIPLGSAPPQFVIRSLEDDAALASGAHFREAIND